MIRRSTIATRTAPIRAPGYVPKVTSTPFSVAGPQRLWPGYTGPLFQLRRASDGFLKDFGAHAGGDVPDYAAIDRWAGNGVPTVAIMYDQTGGGNHWIQPTAASQPSFDTTVKSDGVVSIMFDGQSHSPPGLQSKTMYIAGLSFDIIGNSAFLVIENLVGYDTNALISYSSSDGATAIQETWASSKQLTLKTTGTTETSTDNVFPKCNKTTCGWTNSGTQSDIYTNGNKRSTGHSKSTTAIALMTMGKSIAGGNGYNGRFRLFAAVIYNAYLSNADAATVVAGLNTACSVSTAYDYRCIIDGDSITAGTGCSLLKNTTSLIPRLKRGEFFNMGVHGQVLSTIVAGEVSRFGNLLASYALGTVFIEAAGTNDIGNGVAATTVYSNLSTLVTYIKGLGMKICVCTLLPRADVSWNGTLETQRLAYNAAVIGNAAGADLVLDLASDPIMGTSTTTYYLDGTHPNSAGYQILARRYRDAIAAMLGTTP